MRTPFSFDFSLAFLALWLISSGYTSLSIGQEVPDQALRKMSKGLPPGGAMPGGPPGGPPTGTPVAPGGPPADAKPGEVKPGETKPAEGAAPEAIVRRSS